MKRLFIEIAAQSAALIVLFVVIGVVAVFFGLTAGAVANAIAPDFQLQWADRFGSVCPKSQTVSIKHDRVVTGYDSHGRPYAGQSNDVYCTSTAGGASHLLTSQEYFNAKLAALGVAMGTYTLLCFVPLFLPLLAIAAFLIHKALAARLPLASGLAPPAAVP